MHIASIGHKSEKKEEKREPLISRDKVSFSLSRRLNYPRFDRRRMDMPSMHDALPCVDLVLLCDSQLDGAPACGVRDPYTLVPRWTAL